MLILMFAMSKILILDYSKTIEHVADFIIRSHKHIIKKNNRYI